MRIAEKYMNSILSKKVFPAHLIRQKIFTIHHKGLFMVGEEGCICLCDRGMLPLSVMLHILVEFLETLGTPDGSSPSNLHEAASRHSCCIFTASDSPDKANDSLPAMVALKMRVMKNCCTPEAVWGPLLAVCVTAAPGFQGVLMEQFNQLVENIDVQKSQIVSFFNVCSN